MRKSNKRWLALLLAGAMAAGVTACGGKDTGETTGSGSGEAERSVYRTLYASEVTTLNYLTTGLTNNWSGP